MAFFNYFHGVERDAVIAMLKQIAPQVCAPDGKPYLAIGKKYTTEVSYKSTWVTIHLFPLMCDTIEEGEAWISGHEGGCMVDAKYLCETYYCCFSRRGTCRHCNRNESGALVCDKGHGYADIKGCADVEWKY